MFVREVDDETTDELGADSVTETGTDPDPDPLAGQPEDSATDEQADAGSENAGQTEAGVDAEDDELDSDATTFSRQYVEKLRRESAGYRERAQRADELAARLHTALVAATGRMADPTDLAFDAAHLDDEQALSVAIEELLTRKPHLATRRPFGDVGQGNRGATSEPVNLADMLRSRA